MFFLDFKYTRIGFWKKQNNPNLPRFLLLGFGAAERKKCEKSVAVVSTKAIIYNK